MLGDIKLEINTEYRANLYQFLNGAVFFDAGNIWTYYDDPRFPGGQFTSNFYKELAVDGGVGLRLDFNVVLVRLDLGIPSRKPWLPEGQRWVFDKVDFGSSSWRNENLIFNLAIGYPF
jgi:outer membrane protein assembly factor BamA